MRWAVFALLLASTSALADDTAPFKIDVRESALAATIDMEFQDAMPGGVSGAVILEQDGKVTLRAGYGYADVGKTEPFFGDVRLPTGIMAPFTAPDGTSNVDDVYQWYRTPRVQDDLHKNSAPSPVDWEFRKADDGHIVQISHKGQNGVFLSYFCWRPDDGVFLYFIATGDAKADEILLNRVMTSVRDYGKMPVTDFRR